MVHDFMNAWFDATMTLFIIAVVMSAGAVIVAGTIMVIMYMFGWR